MNDNSTATVGEQKQFALFLRELQERGRSPRTLRAYKFDWSQFATRYKEINQEPFTLERLVALNAGNKFIVFCATVRYKITKKANLFRCKLY